MSDKKQNKNEVVSFLQENKFPIMIGAAVVAFALMAYKNYDGQMCRSSITPTDVRFEKMEKIQEEKKECCAAGGVGIDYATPMQAFKNGKRETVLYTTATRTDQQHGSEAGDFIAVVDVDPSSSTYCQITQQVIVGKGEEVHHSGWNACASCYGMNTVTRKYLVVPAFVSGNIHFIDCSDPKNLKLAKTVSGKMIKEKYGLSFPHTSHCLPNGNIMISFLGVDSDHEEHKENKGADFLWINEDFEVSERWVKFAKDRPEYGYDYWYQPFHNIMVSTEWGTPDAFSQGFNPEHVGKDMYGSRIHFWDWKEHTKIKTVTFPASKVCMPLEIRFLHNPYSVHAFCGAALTSNIIHIYKDDANDGEWKCNPDYIQMPTIEMDNWALPNMPALITDILVSMDDKYLYFSNWLHGDIRQYDISDPFNPKLNSRVFVGGSCRKDSGFNVKDEMRDPPPVVPKVRGSRINGGPQMLQLSLDGTRLYCTNSLFSAYDKQFYPKMVEDGGQMILVDIDYKNGGKMSLNKNFMVDFGKCKGGAARPHEMRYPGGDCTSDIFLAQKN